MSNTGKYTRVTEVLSPFNGLDHINPDVIANAAYRGTKVHKACEAIIHGFGDWYVEEDIRGYINSFNQWWEHGHDVVAVEERFFCSELMITGQIDLMIRNAVGITVIDFKTSASPSKTWPLQGSAYAYLARKNDYDVTAICFLQLKKDGNKPKMHKYDYDMDMFIKCLDVYNYFFMRKS